MSNKKAYSAIKISELGAVNQVTQNSNMGYIQDGQMATMQNAGGNFGGSTGNNGNNQNNP